MSRYASVNPGHGACFHNAIAHWRDARRDGWRIALGVVVDGIGQAHVHAWLEREDEVYAVNSDGRWRRFEFYQFCGIDPSTVRLVNPRSFAKRGEINSHTITQLLNAWGRPWKIKDGGVGPR